MAVYCTLRAAGCCGQRSVVSSDLLAGTDQLCFALTRLMRSATNKHIHGLWTSTINIALQTRQYFGVLALPRFPVLGPRLLLDLRAGPTLFFCKTLAQLLLSALLFKPPFFAFSTVVFRASCLKRSLSWALENAASLESLALFSAVVSSDCVPIDGAGVDDWVHITRGAAGRHSRGKESGVRSKLTWKKARRGRMERVVVLWAQMRTVRLYRELTRLGVCDGLAILSSKVADKRSAPIFVARIVTS